MESLVDIYARLGIKARHRCGHDGPTTFDMRGREVCLECKRPTMILPPGATVTRFMSDRERHAAWARLKPPKRKGELTLELHLVSRKGRRRA